MFSFQTSFDKACLKSGDCVSLGLEDGSLATGDLEDGTQTHTSSVSTVERCCSIESHYTGIKLTVLCIVMCINVC